MKPSVLFILFQITMPKGHKVYPNCNWQVSTEWHTLGFTQLFLLKFTGTMPPIFYEYVLHRFRHKPYKLDLNDKCNLQVHFGSKAMASLYDLLCYHSLISTDRLLEKILSYFPTRFPSHIFDYIACEHSSDDE